MNKINLKKGIVFGFKLCFSQYFNDKNRVASSAGRCTYFLGWYLHPRWGKDHPVSPLVFLCPSPPAESEKKQNNQLEGFMSECN